jgi:hypothetical protein
VGNGKGEGEFQAVGVKDTRRDVGKDKDEVAAGEGNTRADREHAGDALFGRDCPKHPHMVNCPSQF